MKTYTIKIASFVDLITNSSSTIFIAANDKTIVAIKELINCILAGTDVTLTADDLFVFELDEYGDMINLHVKAKNKNSQEFKRAAEIMTSLNKIFEGVEVYN